MNLDQTQLKILIQRTRLKSWDEFRMLDWTNRLARYQKDIFQRQVHFWNHLCCQSLQKTDSSMQIPNVETCCSIMEINKQWDEIWDDGIVKILFIKILRYQLMTFLRSYFYIKLMFNIIFIRQTPWLNSFLYNPW